MVNVEGPSWSSSGSSRTVPPPHLHRVLWIGYRNVYSVSFSVAGVTWHSLCIRQIFTPQNFYQLGYIEYRVYANTPKTISDLKTAVTAAIKSAPWIWGRKGNCKRCPPCQSLPFAPEGLFWTVSWSGCKIPSIINRAFKLWTCLDHRFDLMLQTLCNDWYKTAPFIELLVDSVFFVSPGSIKK